MLKMFRDRENGLCGGACRDSAQISRHLEKADTETLVDELMELTERDRKSTRLNSSHSTSSRMPSSA